jgi:hypothetical protein
MNINFPVFYACKNASNRNHVGYFVRNKKRHRKRDAIQFVPISDINDEYFTKEKQYLMTSEKIEEIVDSRWKLHQQSSIFLNN